MANKGEVTSRTVILWSIASFVLVVVAIAFFAPEQLWSSVTKTAFAFGIGALPDQEAPQLKAEKAPPPQLKSEFDALVKNINSASDLPVHSCLVDITGLNGFEENWYINLDDNKASLYRVDGGSDLEKDSRVLNNFKPCTIVGSSATNFYKRYLIADEKLTIDISPSEKTPITFSESNRYRYLYKNPDNTFCAFKFYDENSCGPPKSSGDLGIAAGCKSKMPQFESGLWMCKDMPLTNALPKSELAAVDAKKIADAIQKGISSTADKCLVRYDLLSLDSWKIGLVKDGSKTKFVQVDGGNNVGKLDVPSVDAVPCIITETLGTTDDDAKEGNLGPSIGLQRIGIKNLGGKYKLTVGNKYDGYDNDYYFNIKEDSPKYSAVYKADSSHICFLPLHRDGNGHCDKATNYIDDDCYIKDWVDKEKIYECSFLDSLDGVFLCDDEHCLDSPPTKPWRKTTFDVDNICNVKPSDEDSEPDGDKICGEIGSIRIIGNYDAVLYENNNYGGKEICFRDEGSYKLDDYPIAPGNGWNKDTDSVKISPDGTCTSPGVTT